MTPGVGTKCPPSIKYSIKEDININTRILENDASINDEKSKHQKTTSKKEQENKLLDMFNKFWQIYPKKKDKEKARKAWLKLKPTDDLLKTILTAVEIQTKSEDWQKNNGQYIPYPTTWINGKRWEDENIALAIQNHQPQNNDRLNELFETQLKQINESIGK